MIEYIYLPTRQESVDSELTTVLVQALCTVHILKFDVEALNGIILLPELKAFSTEQNIDIECIQEHRHNHSRQEIKFLDTGNGWTFVLASAWKNSDNEWTCVSTSVWKKSLNAVIGG